MNTLLRSVLAAALFAAALVFTASVSGCDLLDPSDVQNPDVTQDDFLNFPDPMASWLRGMERQVALALNNQQNDLEDGYIPTAEIASDNYTNTNTFFNQFLDGLTIDNTDDTFETAMQEIADLRESAEFGLSTVVPADANTTDAQRAELHFYKGVAHLLTGEIWHSAPADSGGAAVPSAEQFAIAAASFESALDLAPERVDYRIALARTHRNLGDRAAARAAAEAAIAAEPDFLRFARYDFTNNLENDIQLAMFGRPQNDLQPLPRLDFLDPKFSNTAEPNVNDDQEADLAYIKGEEAFLILAEAQLADGDLAGAQATLRDLLGVVEDRKRASFDDSDDPRENQDGSARPTGADWLVAASPDAPFRDGLLLDRSANITVPVISGTSVTADRIDALADLDEALELLYLMRQEIFIGEGRRMVDLGIKWAVPFEEILVNPNISDGDPAASGQVPDFLPAGEMDAFTVDEEARTITILHNLNRVLVENKASDLVLPFH
jgi:tetratricopeptide (TPR) repeat protein